MSEAADGGGARAKRCKISREQLMVLVDSFEHEPLPNFDQRQALAQRLEMAPRSVQIWFQNRRQRLKPSAQKASDPKASRIASFAEPSQFRTHLEEHQARCLAQPAFVRTAANMARFGMHGGLAAAAAAGLAHSDEMFYRLAPGAPPNGSPFSHGLSFDRTVPLDVMDKFAATKALLGAGARLAHTASPAALRLRSSRLADRMDPCLTPLLVLPSGYHPPSAMLLAAQRVASGGALSAAAPLSASCQRAMHPSMPILHLQPPLLAPAAAKVYARAPGYAAPPPVAAQRVTQTLPAAPPLAMAPVAVAPVATMPLAAADGLLLLLACAGDGIRGSAHPVLQAAVH